MSLNITDKFVNLMDKLVLTTISSIMTILMLTVIEASLTLATLDNEDDSDEVFGDEEECTQKFGPYYDRERYLGCTGGIETPN
jgi:hypothetical protein